MQEWLQAREDVSWTNDSKRSSTYLERIEDKSLDVALALRFENFYSVTGGDTSNNNITLAFEFEDHGKGIGCISS